MKTKIKFRMIRSSKFRSELKVVILLAALCGRASSDLPEAPAVAESPVVAVTKPVSGEATISAPHGPETPFLHEFLALPSWLNQATTNHSHEIPELVHQVENLLSHDKDPEKLQPLDAFLLDVVPLFYGQRPNNENGTKSQYKNYVMSDTSNDDARHLTGVSKLQPKRLQVGGTLFQLYKIQLTNGHI